MRGMREWASLAAADCLDELHTQGQWKGFESQCFRDAVHLRVEGDDACIKDGRVEWIGHTTHAVEKPFRIDLCHQVVTKVDVPPIGLVPLSGCIEAKPGLRIVEEVAQRSAQVTL